MSTLYSSIISSAGIDLCAGKKANSPAGNTPTASACAGSVLNISIRPEPPQRGEAAAGGGRDLPGLPPAEICVSSLPLCKAGAIVLTLPDRREGHGVRGYEMWGAVAGTSGPARCGSLLLRLSG